MPTLNERAHELCDAMVADADTLGIAVSTLECGTRIIDCGVKAPGSVDAGLRLAEICLAGLGTVRLKYFEFISGVRTHIYTEANSPIAACMASQYAGWQIQGEKYFAMGSGPMRAAACREELFQHIGHCEQPTVCVGVLETSKLPPEATCVDIAQKCKISPERLTLLAARTSSRAGTVQVVARSVETALHKLHTLGFDLNRVSHAQGTAPLPPSDCDDLTAIGRTNDAILYGGHATLYVNGDDDSLKSIGARTPSNSSPDHGKTFREIFDRYGGDFYKIDPMLFSPAKITFINLDTHNTIEFGTFSAELLAESFAKK